MNYQFTYSTKIGKITITEENNKITNIQRKTVFSTDIYQVFETELMKIVHTQISEYLDGKRMYFDFPYQMNGTTFQKKVWKAIKDIPYGSKQSYLETAKKINHPLAYRAVGSAASKCHLSLLIPCHRLIGSNNKIGGYGSDLDLKLELLSLEQRSIF